MQEYPPFLLAVAKGGFMYYLGIDVSKKRSDYLILDSQGERFQRSFSLENSREGFEALARRLEEYNLSPENLLSGLEATGSLWENLYSFLIEKGYKVVLLNPYQTRKYHQALRQKATTDQLAALVIADLLRSNRYLSSMVAEEEIEALRELVKLQYQLEGEKKRLQRRILSLLFVVFPEYEKTALKKVFGIAPRKILEKWPTAKDLATAKPRQIEKLVRSIKGNNFNISEIEALIETAKTSIYSGRAREVRSFTIRLLLSQLERTLSSLKKIKEEIEKILSPRDESGSFPGDNILSIPGVGKGTLATFLAIAGQKGSSFSSAKKVIGYLGFYPQIYQSGEKRRDNVISHQGPNYARQSLYMAAVSCIRHNQEMRTLYNKKVSQGKSHKQALIYVAKKLSQMILALLKSGKPYQPERVFVSPTALPHFREVIPAYF
ncbi:MAG: hypothetical protein COZ37_01320 [bacterium (Candidatus Ratteibacteria) CG_4_10_14_3_um_filter_41_18]|uniref:Uncharacterized protein n=2 Tax=Candidatus Ratteibacteria TaxID=2979319 RepID=A0A2M7E9L8_9BACT|nr:MAG: hypothetical protein COS11_02205 [bacterium (Candidatus Ratteibacteria) CG01_land_8_20_14_3_00_40_19]PIX77700.1 MAG: hypothetical protein COZ37_01320 [bacterium (Candidatus Ratteibacteria) CG_4_10_14_3_um_filter_41_18]